jgi:hypothetical protein
MYASHPASNEMGDIPMRNATAFLLAIAAGSASAIAEPAPFSFNTTSELSVAPVGGFDGLSANKGKILRLEYPNPQGGFNVVLLSIYGDSQGPDVWEANGELRPARDLFVTRSTDDGATWSQPVNISNTANLSSINADHDGDPATPEIPFYGDSEKPNAIANGKNVLVSWIDFYAPSGVQRTVTYPEFGFTEVPYGATYSARSTDGGLTWSPAERMTTAERDAKQDVSKASSAGFLVTWQEDPKGLKPGDADGPGEGGSGANVNNGTDIWFSAIRAADFTAGAPFPAGKRITNNFTNTDNDGLESGREGAARANSALFGSTVIVAYEETKGLQGFDTGKYVRYHTFSAFDDSSPDPTNGVGWIISQPDENARRVRFVVQPGQTQNQSNLRIVWIWKEGAYDAGGPSDIICRVGSIDPSDPASTGFRPQDLYPPVDPDATTRENAFNNALGMNLSSSMGLGAHPEDDFFEDARAHRGLVRGDFVVMGWSWTPDWAVARFTDLENYNFYIRRSFDGGRTWTDATNLTNIPASAKVNVREPRIVGTPFSSNPATPSNPEAFLVAWGAEVNQYEHASVGTIDLTISITRTEDNGETFAPVVQLDEIDLNATPDSGAFESQLVLNPQGNRVFAVWQEVDRITGLTDTVFRRGTSCTADFNADGVLDFFDFSAFIDAYTNADPAADLDNNGLFDFFDMTLFVNAFAAGCP